ncbi:MAG: hypothetical protein M9888_10765 [Chitinophagales bacterium]|nr:hypothetical protein [Chitinophagales bacterium]
MSQLIILCVQIIYICLAWSLLTFSIHPFADVFSLFFLDTKAPEWTTHTNYLFAILFLTTGISILLRLKVFKELTQISLTFLVVLWFAMIAQPHLFFINIFKYAYIILIPLIFYMIYSKKAKHIYQIINLTIASYLIYIPIGLGQFFLNTFSNPYALILTGIFSIIAFIIILMLYSRKNIVFGLKLSILFFPLGIFLELLPLIDIQRNFNQLSLIILSFVPVIFTLWFKNMNKSTME